MVRIIDIATGLDLDLPKGEELTFEIEFPGFDDEAIRPDRTLPGNFPLTDRNKIIYKHGHRLDAVNRTKKISVDVYLHGKRYRSGRVILNEVGKAGYRGIVILDEFWVDVVDKTLKDIDYGPDVFLGNNKAEVSLYARNLAFDRHKYEPGAKFTFFPVYNPWYYGGAPQGEEGFGEGVNNDFDGIINSFIHNSFLNVTQLQVNDVPSDKGKVNKHCIQPFVFVHFILERLLENEGYRLRGSFWDHEELRSLCLWHNFPLDEKRKNRFVRATVASTSVMPGEKLFMRTDNSYLEPEDDQGAWSNANGSYIFITPGDYMVKFKGKISNTNPVQDPPSALEFRFRFRDTGVGYDQTFTYTTQLINPSQVYDIEFTEFFTVDWPITSGGGQMEITLADPPISVFPYSITEAALEVTSVRHANMNQYKREVKLKDHVPNVSIGTFLNEMKKLWGLTFSLKPLSNELIIDFQDDYLKPGKLKTDVNISTPARTKMIDEPGLVFKYAWSSANDDLVEDNLTAIDRSKLIGYFTHFPSQAEEGSILIDNKTNLVFVREGGKWISQKDHWPGLRYGLKKDAREVNFQFTPLLMRHNIFMNNFRALMPVVKQLANTPAFDQEDENTALRLVFARGVHETLDINAGTRPLPMASSLNLDFFGNRIGELSLSLNEMPENEDVVNGFLSGFRAKVMNGETVIATVVLTSEDVRNWDWKLNWYIDGVALLPLKATIQARGNGMMKAEVEFFPIKKINFDGEETLVYETPSGVGGFNAKSGGTGGGGETGNFVESVSGSLVDNSDPKNPVINIELVLSAVEYNHLKIDSEGKFFYGVQLSESNEIEFKQSKIQGTAEEPLTGALSFDLTSAMPGVIVKIYHNDETNPIPEEWIPISSIEYQPDVLNIIFAEYCNNDRVEYWITQPIEE